MPRHALLLGLLLLIGCAPLQSTAQSAEAPTVFFLVRHAEKQAGSDPSLTPEGRARATALRDALIEAHVDHVVASQFARTRETAQPLADTLGLPVEARPLDTADVVASAQAVVLALAENYRGQTIVVAGHSNTIPAMVGALMGTDLPEWDERDYDNLMIVLLPPDEPPQLIRARYGAPDPVP
ncbi:MAG: histidine phosphatase family protein [Rhodothermaceae bacterium]|nr:histidine phosphatase family protein [Rhodothermaceae bacterium]